MTTEQLDHEPTHVPRKAVLISLLVNLLVFSCLSFFFWAVRFGAPLAGVFSLVAPVYYGSICTVYGHVEIAIVSCGVSVATAILVLWAIWKPHFALVMLAHLALLLYWFCSFVLIGANV